MENVHHVMTCVKHKSPLDEVLTNPDKFLTESEKLRIQFKQNPTNPGKFRQNADRIRQNSDKLQTECSQNPDKQF